MVIGLDFHLFNYLFFGLYLSICLCDIVESSQHQTRGLRWKLASGKKNQGVFLSVSIVMCFTEESIHIWQRDRGKLSSANGCKYFLMEMLMNVLCPFFFLNKEFEFESRREVHSEVSGCARQNCGASLWGHNLQDTRWLLELAAHTWRLLNELLSATDYILNSPQWRDLRVLICLCSLAWTPPTPTPPRESKAYWHINKTHITGLEVFVTIDSTPTAIEGVNTRRVKCEDSCYCCSGFFR